jgi:poly(3-hydroxybutyrate) depolymerase
MQASGGRDTRAQVERMAARGARALPLIVFHGARDRVARPANAEQIVEQWLHLLARGGVTPRRFEERGDGWTRTRWCQDDGVVAVERWLVDSLGHAWSGGHPDGSFTAADGPSASTEMARFFSAHASRSTPAIVELG